MSWPSGHPAGAFFLSDKTGPRTFGCLDFYFGCLNLYFGCLDLYFGCLNCFQGPPSPVRLCRSCPRRFGDLRKNTPLDLGSMYLVDFVIFNDFRAPQALCVCVAAACGASATSKFSLFCSGRGNLDEIRQGNGLADAGRMAGGSWENGPGRLLATAL